MPSFAIGCHEVGQDHAPFIIAEAGVHHYGSMDLAKAHVLHARVAGAQSIKFQTYTADRLVTYWAKLYWDDPRYETQHEVFKTVKSFTEDQYAELFRFAADLGIVFLSTPFDLDSVTMLDELGMGAFKIASADLTNLPLIRKCAATGKPILLSTGAATFDEVDATVRAVREHHDRIALLHCSLAYPTPIQDANLARLDRLRERFPECVLGYSDHTQPGVSELACPLSVARGARVIEKHFTLNTSLPGDDHYHAVDAEGLKRLVKNCNDAFSMTSGAGREMTEAEQPARHNARRSIVATRKLAAGHTIEASDIDYKRPGYGLSPAEADKVIGRRLTVAVDYDELITMDKLA